jgi:CHAD domain-containing protein
MRGSSPAKQAVRQRLRSLDRGLEVRLGTDPERLHRTRVATRRLREALALCAPADDLEPITELKRLIRDATRALGGVREMDVALTLVDALALERSDLRPALDLVRAAMAAERLGRIQRMRRSVTASRLQRVSRSVATSLDRIDTTGRRGLLGERLLKRTDELRRAVVEAGLLYAPDRLHRIRVATKKLRYVLELGGDMRVASTKRLVTGLERVQDRLGLLHDLETVAYHARRTLGQPNIAQPAAQVAAPTLALLEAKIHAQHADYLADRERLADMLDRTMALSQRLRRARP